MTDPIRVPIRQEGDIVTARQQARGIATSLGFSEIESVMVATALSEIARNIVEYARPPAGEVEICVVEEPVRRGISIVCRDSGPGIPDLPRAMQDGYSSSGGLGLGLPGAKRLMDEFRVESGAGRGTVVTMRKWVSTWRRG